MSDDQNTSQNPTSTENSSPTSPQEPTEQSTENTAHSEVSDALPEALESSPSDFSVKSNDIPLSDSVTPEPEKTQENQVRNEPAIEPQTKAEQPPAEIQTSETAPEPETPQIPVNEPLPVSEPSTSEAKEESKPETKTQEPETSQNEQAKPVSVNSKSSLARELLISARNAIQFRKRKKLDRVMSLFLQQSKITNDEVEKFLHVSDATATRYLSQLEQEGKIKQNGRTGAGVSYSRI